MAAAIIIKSNERRQHEAYVLDSFKKSGAVTAADRDAAAVVTARTREAHNELKKMEVRKNGY